VTIKYLEKGVEDYLLAALKTIFTIHYQSPPGDILVFLSGQDEIENLKSQIETYLPTLDPKKQKVGLACPPSLGL
jgi:HrpA-like RNA helicase